MDFELTIDFSDVRTLPFEAPAAGASRELELLVQLMPADALIQSENTTDVRTDSFKENDLYTH